MVLVNNGQNDKDDMTNELRAVKVADLARLPTCEWVQQTTTGAVLKWPYPINKQQAVIDTTSGEVVGFVRQAGVGTQTVTDPTVALKMIDRRITYLADRYRAELRPTSIPEVAPTGEPSTVF